MEFELDVIRSERRKNTLSLYNLKQYHAIYHHAKDGFDSAKMSDRTTNNFEHKIHKNYSKKKIFSQILPSRLVLDKKDEEMRVDNVSTTLANQRRATDTFSPYGTRTFPSLRQRPPSTDSNLSMSTNSLDFSNSKLKYNLTNGPIDHSSFSTISSDTRKNSSNSVKPMPLSHHRISLTAPRQPPYLFQSQSKTKYL